MSVYNMQKYKKMTDYIVISPEYFKPRRAPSGLAKAIRQTCEATRYKRAGMA